MSWFQLSDEVSRSLPSEQVIHATNEARRICAEFGLDFEDAFNRAHEQERLLEFVDSLECSFQGKTEPLRIILAEIVQPPPSESPQPSC
jgi:hypothetical protein